MNKKMYLESRLEHNIINMLVLLLNFIGFDKVRYNYNAEMHDEDSVRITDVTVNFSSCPHTRKLIG